MRPRQKVHLFLAVLLGRQFCSSAAGTPPRPVSGPTGSSRAAPQAFWDWLIHQGVLNREYVGWINCEGGPWDNLRRMFQAHLEAGRWNYGDEASWLLDHWQLIKEAEEMIEHWRRSDFEVSSDNYTVKEAMQMQSRAASKASMATVTADKVADIIAQHLLRVSSSPKAVQVQSFAAKCLPGLLAALCIFARALAILGTSPLRKAGQSASPERLPEGAQAASRLEDDGFMLWRVEMGFLVAGLMVGEGLCLLDLFSAPGWPGIDTRFLEQTLGRPLKGGDLGLDAGQAFATSVMGGPRQSNDPEPKRLPSVERYHCATDPQSVTSWGKRAAQRAVIRGDAIQVTFAARANLAWDRLGPPYWAPNALQLQEPFCPGLSRRIRLLGLVTNHGALDLEVPELLLHLFPRWLQAQFFFGGTMEGVMCKKTEGSSTMVELCAEREKRLQRRLIRKGNHLRHRRRRRRQGRQNELRFGRLKLGNKTRKHMLEGRSLPNPRDQRLLFVTDTGRRVQPDLITTTGFLEAIWLDRRFPSVPLVLFFGPPVMLLTATDVVDGHVAIVESYWQGVRRILRRAGAGEVLIAAESLFRAEQFFWQTSVEVPFLRPMSTWVNATYSPAKAPFQGGEILFHSRGRLKYEVDFITTVKLMTGPRFPYQVVEQKNRVFPFKEIAAFHAVVIIPWSPELCFLRNLFKMRMPLFVPDLALLRNLVHIANIRLMPYPYNQHDPQSNRGLVEAVHPFDPFVDTARSPSDVIGTKARAYWAEYSEYLLMPELLHFASAADLLAKLNGMEGKKVSQRMRAAYLNDLQEMTSFWQEALPVLVIR